MSIADMHAWEKENPRMMLRPGEAVPHEWHYDCENKGCEEVRMSKLPNPDKFPETPEGAWVAYYPDLSGVAVFSSELEALRYAVSRSMLVKFLEYGKEIGS